MEFSRPRILEWVAYPFPGDLPNPGVEPRSPALQAYSLPTEPQPKKVIQICTGSLREQDNREQLLGILAETRV